jgi:hypothetical protein
MYTERDLTFYMGIISKNDGLTGRRQQQNKRIIPEC